MRSKWDEQRGDLTYGEQTIEKAFSMTDKRYNPDYGTVPTDNQQADTADITIEDVRRVVRTEFGDQTWDVTEAVLSAHVTMLLEGQGGGAGLVITGLSGSGKTTILKFFDGLDEMFYRSDDVTPASFVSHDSSKSEEQLQEVDLLPRIKQKTLVSRDMSPWFAGDKEAVYKRMSIMAPLMDGDGYTSDSGSHGQRGYTGDEYRFNFIGATTPLSPRAWYVMGTVGNRLLFHQKQADTDMSSIVDEVITGSDYATRVHQCQSVVKRFLRQLWNNIEPTVEVVFDEDLHDDIRDTLQTLTELIRHGRAPVVNDVAQLEGGHRVTQSLFSIAKGNALLHGRRRVLIEDMQVCGRIALSTIPRKRRSLIQALLNPESGQELKASDVDSLLGVSRPTSLNRMDELATLRIADLRERDDGRETKALVLREQFQWPEALDFPSF
jgi:hypothetical protein